MKTDNYKFTPHELRIGSLVKRRSDNLTVSINHPQLKLICENEELFNVTYSPIPLTEEWLLKFGFEKVDSGLLRYKNGIWILEYLFDKWNFRIYTDPNHSTFLCELDYVHQLQGLFYELKREMLTLKDR